MKKYLLLVMLSSFSMIIKVKGQCPATPPLINGPNLVCLGTSSSYFAKSSTPSNFLWSTTGGGTISGNNQATITWTTTGTFELTVIPTSISGCSNPPVGTYSVTVINSTTIAAPSTITGPLVVCQNSAISTYSVPAINGQTPVWEIENADPISQNTLLPTLTISNNQVTVNWTNSTPGSYILLVSYTNGVCSGNQKVLRINLTAGNEPLALNGNSTNKYCINETASYTVTGNPQDSFLWSLPLGGGVLNTSGNSAIVTWTSQGNFSISVTATNTCFSTPRIVTKSITVGPPKPSVPGSITSTNTTLCINSPQTFSIPSQQGVTSYNWNFSTSGSTTNQSSTTNSLTISLTQSELYTVNVKASNGYCESDPSINTFTVIGTPATPTITGNNNVCVGNTLTLNATPLSQTNTYTWTTPDGVIDPLATGGIIHVRWDAPGSKIISVIAKNQCGIMSLPPNGNTFPFNVNIQSPTISLEEIQGTKSVCLGNYRYTTSSNSNTSSLSWTLTGGGVLSTSSNTNDELRSINWTTPGNGYVLTVEAFNSCGATLSKSISIDVKAGTKPTTPLINGISSEIVCAQSTPTVKNYSVPLTNGYSYNWELFNPNGNTFSSTGNTASVTLNQPSSCFLSVTPSTSVCSGERTPLSINYDLINFMTNPASFSICNGVALNIPLTPSLPATEISWIATDNPNTTGESLNVQYTSAINNTITNLTSSPQTVTYTVTPRSAYCQGTAQTVSVVVMPSTVLTNTFPAAVCSGTALNINLTSNVPATFKWIAADNTNTTGESLANQSLAKINNTITNNTTTAQPVVYTITPTSVTAACAGNPQVVTINVNPKPSVTNPLTAEVCSGSAVSIVLTSTIPSTFTWIAANNANTTGESTTMQSSSTLNNTITNTALTSQVVNYTVTPKATGSLCTGSPQVVAVTVKPKPNAVAANQVICSGNATSIPITSAVSGTTFAWPAPTVTNVTGGTAGAGTSLAQTLTSSPATSTGTASYVITPTANGCTGTPVTVVTTVNPKPVGAATNQTINSGGTTAIALTANLSPTTFTWPAPLQTNVTGATAGSNTTISQTLINPTAAAGSAVYTITPTANTCDGTPFSVTAFVNAVLPVGSTFANPITIGTLTVGSVFSDTVNNDVSYLYGNDYTGADNQVSDDIFYKFYLPATLNFQVTTQGSAIDTYIHLLDANGTQLLSNDDFNSGTSSATYSYLKTNLAAGYYYLVVEGYSNRGGLFITPTLTIDSPLFPITWTDLVSVSANANTVTKTSTDYTWLAGAASGNFIPPYTNGWIEMEINNINWDIMFGLSAANPDAAWNSIEYNCYVSRRNNFVIKIYKLGALLSANVSAYAVGDKFRIERIGSTITFKRNNTVIYSTPGNSAESLRADVSLFDPGSQIYNAYCSHSASGGQVGRASTVANLTVGKYAMDSLTTEMVKTKTNTLYPNPTAGKVTLYYADDNTGPVHVRLVNSLGTQLHHRYWSPQDTAHELVLDISHYPSGIYFIYIEEKAYKLIRN